LPSAIPLLLFLMITMAANVQARPLAEEPGWRARVGLVVGFASRRSQFDTDSGNRVTSNLANPGQRSERGLLFPLARIDYTLPGLSTQFFLGNSRDQVSRAQFQYELGLTHRFADDSRLTLAWFPELPFLDETWQDPYLVGSPRQETDERFQGARVAFERIAGSRLTLKYAYAESDVELERSGAGLGLAPSERALLRRDSRYHRVEGELNLPLGDGWSWRPALQLTDAQADGEASSYEEAVLRLGLDGRRWAGVTTSAPIRSSARRPTAPAGACSRSTPSPNRSAGSAPASTSLPATAGRTPTSPSMTAGAGSWRRAWPTGSEHRDGAPTRH
jgi:hypothetical protein